MSVQVGIGTFSGQAAPGQVHADVYEQLLSLARVADDAGLDSFWVSSHHGTPNGHLPSPLALLGAAAAVTRRIRLGTAMVIGPFQHPLRFAEDCVVVSRLSGGRLLVGVGSGWRREEFEAFGVPIGQRAARTADLVRRCRVAWDDPALGLSLPSPIPILMGGRAPRAIARAGRLADGFIATGLPDRMITRSEFRDQLATFDGAARAARRNPDELLVGFQADCWLSRDGSLAPGVVTAMRNQFGSYLRWHGIAAPAAVEQLIRDRAIAGTPPEVAEALQVWVEEFGDRQLLLILRVYYPGIDPLEAEAAVRLLAAEVLPALKRSQPTLLEPIGNGEQ